MKTQPTYQLPALLVPDAIDAALRAGADMAWSLSGGKDSHALCLLGPAWFRAQGYPGQQYIIHADLGRAEWHHPQANTAAFVEKLAAQVGLPLVITQRTKGDLVARIEERLAKTQADAQAAGTTAVPFWPSSASRYCTAHLKAGPIDTALRQPAPFWPSSSSRYCTAELKRNPIDKHLRTGGHLVVSAEGVRANESRERAKKPGVEVRGQITSSSTVCSSRNLKGMAPLAAVEALQDGQRVALTWRPLLHFTEEDIWQAIGHSRAELEARRELFHAGQVAQAFAGWLAHRAYVMGNERLSCALCVLATNADLLNGAQHHPQLYGHFIELEIIGGSTFKDGWSLAQLPVTGEAARVRDEVLAKYDYTPSQPA